MNYRLSKHDVVKALSVFHTVIGKSWYKLLIQKEDKKTIALSPNN
jgi:hypothetical protein